jgi:Fatty acid desaturase
VRQVPPAIACLSASILRFGNCMLSTYDDACKTALRHTRANSSLLHSIAATQVRHSGNFSMASSAATQLFGGINYQIEHHLFPSMCHMHYWHVAPVVQATCAEFDVPYNAHPTLASAYWSYLKTLYHCGPAKSLEAETVKEVGTKVNNISSSTLDCASSSSSSSRSGASSPTAAASSSSGEAQGAQQ